MLGLRALSLQKAQNPCPCTDATTYSEDVASYLNQLTLDNES